MVASGRQRVVERAAFCVKRGFCRVRRARTGYCKLQSVSACATAMLQKAFCLPGDDELLDATQAGVRATRGAAAVVGLQCVCQSECPRPTNHTRECSAAMRKVGSPQGWRRHWCPQGSCGQAAGWQEDAAAGNMAGDGVRYAAGWDQRAGVTVPCCLLYMSPAGRDSTQCALLPPRHISSLRIREGGLDRPGAIQLCGPAVRMHQLDTLTRSHTLDGSLRCPLPCEQDEKRLHCPRLAGTLPFAPCRLARASAPSSRRCVVKPACRGISSPAHQRHPSSPENMAVSSTRNTQRNDAHLCVNSMPRCC